VSRPDGIEHHKSKALQPHRLLNSVSSERKKENGTERTKIKEEKRTGRKKNQSNKQMKH
jgi:hypothetical protein